MEMIKASCRIDRVVPVLSFFFLLAPAVFAGAAGSTIVIDADHQFRFAEHCFSTHQYDRAIGEYQRYIYFFPEGDKVESAMVGIAMSYMYNGRLTEAIEAFEAVLKKYKDTDKAIKSSLWMSECQSARKDFGGALLTLQNTLMLSADPDLKDEVHYRMGWVYVEMADWEKAWRSFDKIRNENRDRYLLEKISAEIDRTASLPQKDPALAGLLSIVPGAGQAYCGRYHDAAIAFLLNFGLAYAAYECFDQGLNGLGAVISFVELGFYAGNIYGAVSSAHKTNRSVTESFIETLKQQTKIQLSSASDDEAGGKKIWLSFHIRF